MWKEWGFTLAHLAHQASNRGCLTGTGKYSIPLSFYHERFCHGGGADLRESGGKDTGKEVRLILFFPKKEVKFSLFFLDEYHSGDQNSQDPYRCHQLQHIDR